MPAILSYMHFVISALRKLPDYQGFVYRGNNSPEIVKKEYTVGREIFWSAFTSTTTEMSTARSFAGKDGVVFKIKIHSGKVISMFSVLGGENEVLLPPNSCFVVGEDIFIDKDDGMLYLKLVEKAGQFHW
jgi:hypothetical protein